MTDIIIQEGFTFIKQIELDYKRSPLIKTEPKPEKVFFFKKNFYYSKYDLLVFTVMDKVKAFNIELKTLLDC